MNTQEFATLSAASVGMTADAIRVRGGKPIHGRLQMKGAKNLVTKAMVASLLGHTPSELRSVPEISDVKVVRGLLEVYGVVVEVDGDTLRLDPSNVERAHETSINA
ncbi:MAG TPA: UDP-N-acetylglucosamine 1-carboxyvinyltransferase, partial [Candidatus Agrococcus pullicola]|nr:UDP-N-acetylglucosamine 1-carboxyvinyltransferase [Candidatus Agrococcus pullicola]